MGFIFGGNTGETQESIKRKRDYAQALMAAKGAPRDVGEGLNSLGNAIAYRMALSQIGKGEAAMAEKNSALMAPIVESFGGGKAQFPAPPSQGQSTGNVDTASAPSATGVDVAKRLQQDFNLSPEAAAGFAGNLAHESGDFKTLQEIAPTVKGSRGGYGWAQWTGPRRRAYEAFASANGLDPASPEANYGFLKTELQGSEGGVLKALHGINDPAQAAQIVSDKFLRPGIPHMGSRISKAQKIAEMLRGGGVQVASLDPSIGGASDAPAEQPQSMYVGEVGANGAISTKERPAANAIRKMLGGQEQPAPVQIAQAAPQGQVSEQQVVQELFGSPAPRPQLNPGMLMQALSDPNISEQNRATLQGLLQNEMKKADPAYQAQQQMDQIGLQKARIELQKLQNPDPVAPKFENVGGRLVKINPDGSVSEAYAPPPEPEKVSKPAEIQEYEYAVGQGFPGTFSDWKASQKGGMSIQTNPDGTMTFQQGNNIKPMTEAQSKDTVYAVRAEGSLPILDDLDKELTGLVGNTFGQLPIVGNAMKPEKFQQAEQASNEFLQAILRKDTGAAITEGEQALYGNTYIPRMGDGPDVIAQKKSARFRALQAMKAGMTPQAILAQEQALQKSGNAPMQPQAAQHAPAAPTEKKRFKYNPATGELE